MARKDELGIWGERVASDYLDAHGYAILDRRWRCARGEIDLVAAIDSTIAFVEVKTRRSLAYGHPLEAITAAKCARLRSLAGEWCAAHDVSASTVRIDAIGVVGDGHRVESLDHRQAILA